jgi:hypothetical protein
MVNVSLATVTCPVRLLPGFAWIVNETVPEPDLFVPGGTTIQGESLVTVHEHPVPVTTVAIAVPAASLNDVGATSAV